MAALGDSYCRRFDFDQKAFLRPSCPIKDFSEIFFSFVEPVPSKKATPLMEPTDQRKRRFEILRKVQMRCEKITEMVNKIATQPDLEKKHVGIENRLNERLFKALRVTIHD